MTERKMIEVLAEIELKSANEKHPLFQSPHEAYAVLLEEVEELEEELEHIKRQMGYIWETIRKDDNSGCYIENINHFAVNAALEAIQVAAMCEKVKQSGLY